MPLGQVSYTRRRGWCVEMITLVTRDAQELILPSPSSSARGNLEATETTTAEGEERPDWLMAGGRLRNAGVVLWKLQRSADSLPVPFTIGCTARFGGLLSRCFGSCILQATPEHATRQLAARNMRTVCAYPGCSIS